MVVAAQLANIKLTSWLFAPSATTDESCDENAAPNIKHTKMDKLKKSVKIMTK